MKTSKLNYPVSIPCVLLFVLLLIFTVPARAQENQSPKGESPYFLVITNNAELDQLPLTSTRANVRISGVIADVTITQEYKNDGKTPLEAIYTFPASAQAAVYGMEMRIGDRKIVAKIEEKQKARQQYETAKADGKRTSLLEQQRPNVFQMNVANIMPGDVVKVTLRYTELLVPQAGVYQFVYPTVVGPRYSGEVKSSVRNAFLNTAHSLKGELPTYDFSIDVSLSTGMPVQHVVSPTHKIVTSSPSATQTKVVLSGEEHRAGNRDFVLDYQLAGNSIESGLMLYEHGDENFFLLMVQPSKRIVKEEIPPREYIFIVDVSGSMHGFPINTAKTLMRNLILNLRPTDRFNVLIFESGAYWLGDESLPATQDNFSRAATFLDTQRGGGGTNLLAALKKAMSFPRQQEGLSRSFVVVTDGYVGVEKEAFDIIRTKADQANTFAFGIGSSVNRYLIDGIAHAGMSEPFIVLTPEHAAEQAEKFRNYINYPVLTQIKKSFNGLDVYDVEPVSIPDVLAERPVIVYGKYRGKATGTITIEGLSGKKKYKKTFDVSQFNPDTAHEAIRYLWARKKIQLLDDYSNIGYEVSNQEVINLGLKYNLMTAYTSFIAIEEKIANESSTLTTVKQPLPMPVGVENSAIGLELEIDDNELIFSSHKKIELSATLTSSAKRQVIANLEKTIVPQINALLEAHHVIPDAIVVIVDEKGHATISTVKGKSIPEELLKALQRLVAKHSLATLKMEYAWTYTIVF